MHIHYFKRRLIVFYFILILLLHSCSGGLSDASKVLRNEKARTTDEFLVKKRAPLALPPNYESLPTPGSQEKVQNDNENKIKSILAIPEKSASSKTTTVEQLIISKIGK